MKINPFSSISAWPPASLNAYTSEVEPLLKERGKVLRTSTIKKIIQNNAPLQEVSLGAIRNKMNADIQRLRRQSKQMIRPGKMKVDIKGH